MTATIKRQYVCTIQIDPMLLLFASISPCVLPVASPPQARSDFQSRPRPEIRRPG